MTELAVAHQRGTSGGTFTIERDGQQAAEMTYRMSGAMSIVVDHTLVAPSLRGTGAGMRLLTTLVDWARQADVRVTATCSYAVAMFAKHPELRDVYDG